MRGKALPYTVALSYTRITPAHAGKSTGQKNALAKAKDHPRTCGEKRCRILLRCRIPGSPPHMRGKD